MLKQKPPRRTSSKLSTAGRRSLFRWFRACFINYLGLIELRLRFGATIALTHLTLIPFFGKVENQAGNDGL